MKIVVAITGASGAIYGIRLLEALRGHKVETHLILSKWGKETIRIETDLAVAAVEAMATKIYEEDDLAAAVSSGSFLYGGMVVAPCSMKTLSGIAHGYAEGLVQRAADVCIKERRKLILCVRESPLSPIHLENMLLLSRLGVDIMPPMPAFYNRPQNLDDIVRHHTGKVLDHLGIKHQSMIRWGKED